MIGFDGKREFCWNSSELLIPNWIKDTKCAFFSFIHEFRNKMKIDQKLIFELKLEKMGIFEDQKISEHC
jgi:hypothetical protein